MSGDGVVPVRFFEPHRLGALVKYERVDKFDGVKHPQAVAAEIRIYHFHGDFASAPRAWFLTLIARGGDEFDAASGYCSTAEAGVSYAREAWPVIFGYPAP